MSFHSRCFGTFGFVAGEDCPEVGCFFLFVWRFLSFSAFSRFFCSSRSLEREQRDGGGFRFGRTISGAGSGGGDRLRDALPSSDPC